ncbi:MAG: hypothetical protein AB7F96_09985 [Beijerinckiaceae bacterium]
MADRIGQKQSIDAAVFAQGVQSPALSTLRKEQIDELRHGRLQRLIPFVALWFLGMAAVVAVCLPILGLGHSASVALAFIAALAVLAVMWVGYYGAYLLPYSWMAGAVALSAVFAWIVVRMAESMGDVLDEIFAWGLVLGSMGAFYAFRWLRRGSLVRETVVQNYGRALGLAYSGEAENLPDPIFLRSGAIYARTEVRMLLSGEILGLPVHFGRYEEAEAPSAHLLVVCPQAGFRPSNLEITTHDSFPDTEEGASIRYEGWEGIFRIRSLNGPPSEATEAFLKVLTARLDEIADGRNCYAALGGSGLAVFLEEKDDVFVADEVKLILDPPSVLDEIEREIAAAARIAAAVSDAAEAARGAHDPESSNNIRPDGDPS